MRGSIGPIHADTLKGERKLRSCLSYPYPRSGALGVANPHGVGPQVIVEDQEVAREEAPLSGIWGIIRRQKTVYNP